MNYNTDLQIEYSFETKINGICGTFNGCKLYSECALTDYTTVEDILKSIKKALSNNTATVDISAYDYDSGSGKTYTRLAIIDGKKSTVKFDRYGKGEIQTITDKELKQIVLDTIKAYREDMQK